MNFLGKVTVTKLRFLWIIYTAILVGFLIFAYFSCNTNYIFLIASVAIILGVFLGTYIYFLHLKYLLNDVRKLFIDDILYLLQKDEIYLIHEYNSTWCNCKIVNRETCYHDQTLTYCLNEDDDGNACTVFELTRSELDERVKDGTLRIRKYSE